MQVWKRRLAVLAAMGVGSAGLMTSAGAQTPPSIPGFTIPSFTLPPFTIPPPPTMPPPTSPPATSPPPTMPPPTSTPPPPTMPPTSSPPSSTPPPPTMPPTSSPPSTSPPVTFPSFPAVDEIIEDLLDRLEDFIGEDETGFDQLQEFVDRLRSDFFR